MAKQKARKVVVAFTVVLNEESRNDKIKTLKDHAESEASYLGEAVGGVVKKVAVADAE